MKLEKVDRLADIMIVLFVVALTLSFLLFSVSPRDSNAIKIIALIASLYVRLALFFIIGLKSIVYFRRKDKS